MRERREFSNPSVKPYPKALRNDDTDRLVTPTAISHCCLHLSTLCEQGLDRLLSFMIVQALTDFVKTYRRFVVSDVARSLTQTLAALSPLSHFPPHAAAAYADAAKRCGSLFTTTNPFHQFILRVGQCQLLRRQVGNELNFSCKLDSTLLANTLGVMNATLLNDLRSHYARPDTKPYPVSERVACCIVPFNASPLQ